MIDVFERLRIVQELLNYRDHTGRVRPLLSVEQARALLSLPVLGLPPGVPDD